MKTQEETLSWRALGRIVLVGAIILLLWKAVGAMTIIVVALIFAVSLYPIVEFIRTKTKIPMLLSILLVIILLLLPFFVIAIAIIPSFNTQFPMLLTQINVVIKNIPFVSNSLSGFDISQYLQAHYSFLMNYSLDIILSVVSIVTIIVLTFYFIYDHERLYQLFLNIFPNREKNKLEGILGEIAKVIGQYMRGNVLISVISAIVVYIGLLIIGVPFALPLAIFSGILDLLPLVGSTLGAIPSLLIAFSISPIKGLLVIVLFVIYQQVENVFISPAIYNKALNLYPALVFLAIIVGASLFGMLGAFLALPVAASIPALIKYRQNYKERHQD